MTEQNFSTADFEKMLSEESKFNNFCFLNSNGFNKLDTLNLSRYNFLAGIDSMDEISLTHDPYSNERETLTTLQNFLNIHKSKWKFGFISYDAKNEIEKLPSGNFDGLQFPCIHFFVPHYVLLSQNEEVKVINQKNSEAENLQLSEIGLKLKQEQKKSVILKSRFSNQEYLKAVSQLKKHIQRGDIYEITFAQEFFNNNAEIFPFDTYIKLNTQTPAPMSCFYKSKQNYLISSSPERFLCKHGNKIYSQPIKGTIKRGNTKEEDEQLKNLLLNSEKERAENVMIVDLVRNDLSRIAKQGSVKVEELFGLYSFSKVHQLISTVSCELDETKNFTDIIRATFPMGSMTGAPKISAMQLIEQFEKTKRGLFSGCVGYIAPDGDFDFNVVIRSILYNAEKKYVSVQAGGAITSLSDAEEEFDESILKAKAMVEVLSQVKVNG